MRFSSRAAAAVLAGASCVESFTAPSSLSRTHHSVVSSPRMAAAGSEFESILGEGASYQEAANALRQQRSSRRSTSSLSPIIRVPDGSPAATVTLTSSVTAEEVYGDDLVLEDESLMDSSGNMVEEEAAYDPLVNNQIMKRQNERKLNREQSKGVVMKYVKNPLLLVKGKDFADITLTVLIPAFLLFFISKKAAGAGFGSLGVKAEGLYKQGALDICKHVGDYEEMEQVWKDSKKKLWFNGAPSFVATSMMEKLAKTYCMDVPIRPNAMSSFAYLIQSMKLSDVEVAEAFLLAFKADFNSVSTANKLLFYATHLLKDPAAMNKMKEIIFFLEEMLGGKDMMKFQLKDLGARAYRDAVAEGGKGQTEPLKGYTLLGLSKEEATTIFEETKKMGFLSSLEYMRELELQDKAEMMAEQAAERKALKELREQVLDDNPDVKADDFDKEQEDDKVDKSGGNVRECGKCGYTLFIAKGRDVKFFSSGFKCPQCGGARDQFKDVDVEL